MDAKASLEFWKVQGLGNDFVLLDHRDSGSVLSTEQAIALCDRRRGVGADGVLTLLPAEGEATARMYIQNADGSVPEMCGNGLRCVVQFLAQSAESGAALIRVETDAGPREGRLDGKGEVRVWMGHGRVEAERLTVNVQGFDVTGVSVDTGNPHLVLFLESGPVAGLDLTETALAVGPGLCKDPRFPEGVNVGFARRQPGWVELVVFERGAGLTQACGTGAMACALTAVASGRCPSGEVVVQLPGGRLRVEVGGPDDPIWMTGGAEVVFQGRL